jgi:tRNA1Val (adenine37-N6)-methyltransferase
MSKQVFKFKEFEVIQDGSTMKVGTDGVLLGAWASVDSATEILDIGTGTGVIALMLAQRNRASSVHAVEIDELAYLQAKENFKNSTWSDKMRCFHMSIQDFATATEQQYDLIVSNPPFFTGGTLSDNSDKVSVRHTIKLPHGDLLLSVRQLLKKNGKFCVVLPYLEGLRFKEMAQTSGLFCNKATGVKPNALRSVERLLLEFSYIPGKYVYNELSLNKPESLEWTIEYKNLTNSFYLAL